jgi:nucleoid-associated protein EbfC|tara:strand:- start:216 stop:545 length:330 start_codon:yes stop_codon:yes gene_type:complete
MKKMTDFTDMLSKAKAMQDKMKEAQEQIKKIEVEGEAGGNLVKIILTGNYELKSISISPEAKKESQEIINDLIIAAYNNAKENLKKKSAEELSKVTGGLNLPLDFKLPF